MESLASCIDFDRRSPDFDASMSLRVLIIPDKFKGTLTATAAAAAIAEGWRSVRPDDELTLLPMSDGGDGFGEIFGRLLHSKKRTIHTIDAAHRRIRASWWFDPRTGTAIVESASVIGLAMLPSGKYHPFDLDTFGLGTVLTAAARRGARLCLVGIGGSATNDGGFGMARALGWRFLSQDGHMIERWIDLAALARILPPAKSPLRGMNITVAMDVQNRLLGKHGATRVYGPQKGLRAGDFALAERCLRRLAWVMKRQSGKDFASMQGAGAAGGLGFGLFAFADADSESGTELFSRHAKLMKQLKAADLVITGEGSIDTSTLMGKGVGDLARLCSKLKIPCLGLAGVLRNEKKIRRAFGYLDAIVPGLAGPRSARSAPALWLKRLTARAGRRRQPRPRDAIDRKTTG